MKKDYYVLDEYTGEKSPVMHGITEEFAESIRYSLDVMQALIEVDAFE